MFAMTMESNAWKFILQNLKIFSWKMGFKILISMHTSKYKDFIKNSLHLIFNNRHHIFTLQFCIFQK